MGFFKSLGRIGKGILTGGLSEVSRATGIAADPFSVAKQFGGGGGLGGLFGGGGAGGDASGAIGAANQQAIGEIRRQFDVTQGNLQPFISAGKGALPDVQQGSTIGGFGKRLGEIFSGGSLDPLIEQRTNAVQGQLAAGGLTRSGEGLRQIANVPTDLGFDLERMLFGRSAGLASGGAGAAGALGGFGAGASGGIADLFRSSGQARSSGILADQQAGAAQTSNLLGIGASLLPLFFGSDPDLKENIKEVGNINGLKVYKWDWIPGAKGTFIEKCPTKGFMSTEVKEKYPQFVQKFGGYDVIAYLGLLDHLEAENNILVEVA